MSDLRLTRESEVTAENPVAGDLYVEGRELVLVTGTDAVRQELEVEYRWWRGEWFADLSRGVPYVGEVFPKGTSARAITALLKRVGERVPGVRRMLSVSLSTDRRTRLGTARIVAQLDDGSTVGGEV